MIRMRQCSGSFSRSRVTTSSVNHAQDGRKLKAYALNDRIKSNGLTNSHVRQSLDNQIKQCSQPPKPAQVAMVPEPDVTARRCLSKINTMYACRIVPQRTRKNREAAAFRTHSGLCAAAFTTEPHMSFR